MTNKERYDHSVCVYINGPGEYQLLVDMANNHKNQMILRLINTSKGKLNSLGFNPVQFKFQKPQAVIGCKTEEMKAFVVSSLQLYRKNVEFLESCYKAIFGQEPEQACDSDEKQPPHYDNWP